MKAGSAGCSGFTNWAFTLTAEDISNKSITLSGTIASGKDSSVLCFIGGSV